MKSKDLENQEYSTTNAVSLPFKHALTQVLFNLKGDDETVTYTVKSVAINGVFKDGKYKFEVLNLEHYHVTGASGIRSWYKVDYKDSWTHFKKDGEVRKMYVDNIVQITSFFNGLSKNLYDYIYNQNETAKSNDW